MRAGCKTRPPMPNSDIDARVSRATNTGPFDEPCYRYYVIVTCSCLAFDLWLAPLLSSLVHVLTTVAVGSDLCYLT